MQMPPKKAKTVLALIVTLAFVLPLFQFAFLQSYRDHYSGELVNDGHTANFFTLRARPYYVMPEDFYLYVVRAKRIAERGWSSDLLWGRDAKEAGSNYSAPLQVGLGYVASLTDGKPLPYMIFLMTLLFFSWSSLVLISLRELRRYDFVPILAISLTVAIFELPVRGLISLACGYLPALSMCWENEIWPPFKTLRFSTYGWSLPLLIGFAIMAANLVTSKNTSRSRYLGLFVILCLFALGDVWSFLVAIGILGLAAVAHIVLVCSEYPGPRNWRLIAKKAVLNGNSLALAAIAFTAATLFIIFSGPAGGDVNIRSGFGAEWLESRSRINGSNDGTFLPFLSASMAYVIFAVLALRTRARREILSAILIGGLPLATSAVYAVIFWIVGAYAWQLPQFYDRSYACAFLGAAVTGWILLRLSLFSRAATRQAYKQKLIKARYAAGAFLVVFLLLHVARIHAYIDRVGVRDYALTQQLESLKPVLQNLEKTRKRASLATLSHEINYLAAYWTNFDLVLPEGFPLHYAGTNLSIADRMASLLSFYGATPQSWQSFNLRRMPADQFSWMESRTLSEREGYGYYLFHQMEAGGIVGDPFGSSTTMVSEAMSRRDPGSPMPSPDIVILDQTSNFIGRPNLDHYSFVWKSKDIEVYQRIN